MPSEHSRPDGQTPSAQKITPESPPPPPASSSGGAGGASSPQEVAKRSRAVRTAREKTRVILDHISWSRGKSQLFVRAVRAHIAHILHAERRELLRQDVCDQRIFGDARVVVALLEHHLLGAEPLRRDGHQAVVLANVRSFEERRHPLHALDRLLRELEEVAKVGATGAAGLCPSDQGEIDEALVLVADAALHI